MKKAACELIRDQLNVKGSILVKHECQKHWKFSLEKHLQNKNIFSNHLRWLQTLILGTSFFQKHWAYHSDRLALFWLWSWVFFQHQKTPEIKWKLKVEGGSFVENRTQNQSWLSFGWWIKFGIFHAPFLAPFPMLSHCIALITKLGKIYKEVVCGFWGWETFSHIRRKMENWRSGSWKEMLLLLAIRKRY